MWGVSQQMGDFCLSLSLKVKFFFKKPAFCIKMNSAYNPFSMDILKYHNTWQLSREKEGLALW